MTVGDLTEQGLIERIRQWTASPVPVGLELGIGDDGAILRPGSERVVATVDMLAEGVDFDRRYAPLEQVGRKAAAANLSDLAAMGARPVALLVALACPTETEVSDLQALFTGLTRRAAEHGAAIAGGDLSSPPAGDRGMTLTVTALGQADDPLRRSGARAGDLVCVTGTLGDSALGLALLRADRGHTGSAPLAADQEDATAWLTRRHLDPQPRVEAGRVLASLADAMIDASDGFVADLRHITEASGVGALVELDKLPRSGPFRALAGDKADTYVLSGGEDFELICALRPDRLERLRAKIDVPLTVVGEFEPGSDVRVRASDGSLVDAGAGGWQHFRSTL